jgi:hypothetical protein
MVERSRLAVVRRRGTEQSVRRETPTTLPVSRLSRAADEAADAVGIVARG